MSIPTRILAIVALAGLAMTGPAFAHAALQSATPAAGSTVATSPAALDLKFSEDLNLRFSGVELTGPDGKAVQTGDPTLTDKNATLVVPVIGALGAGTYAVLWHALSADGHKTHGTYTFTVKP